MVLNIGSLGQQFTNVSTEGNLYTLKIIRETEEFLFYVGYMKFTVRNPNRNLTYLLIH